MVEISRGRVECNGLQISYLEAGEGPPVVFIHGWPTNAELWRTVLTQVGKTHRAIAIDLPGFGRSDKPTDTRYSFRFFSKVLDGFADALGLQRFGLVVHDLGGPIGLYWAVHNPGRIRELALLNTLCFPELSWAVKAFVLSTYVPGVRGLLSSPRGVRWSMLFGVNDKTRITDEVAALYTAPYENDAGARKALLMAGQGLRPKRFREISEGLHQFGAIPVRLLYGEDDRILPKVADTMRRVAELLPNAQTTALAGCGHFLQEDRPTEVAEQLASFFATAADDAAAEITRP
ncbi:MAG: alpha/beta fold hydrolase [Nannocystaceae bacterium]|nr:alpha/beta fold hydrolase [Nannocystaceae bacterium]